MGIKKRLIDANALKRALCTKEGAEALGHSTVKLARVSAVVDAQPTVDAVEVVRCKDCKFALSNPFNAGKLVCSKGGNWRGVEPNHFCSYGERREGE